MKLWPILFALLAQDPNQDPALIEHTRIVKVEADPAAVSPGQEFTLTFTVQVDPEWHIYSTTDKGSPTAWKFDPPVEPAGEPVEPKPKVHRTDLGGGKVHENLIHEGEVQFKVPVRLARNAPPGPLKIKGLMTGMECDPRVCIGFEYAFAADITVQEGLTTPPPPDTHTRLRAVSVEPSTAKAGETVRLVFKVAIDEGWHIGSAVKSEAKTEVELNAGAPAELIEGAAEEPAPQHKKEPLGNGEFLESWEHEGEVTFRFPVKVKPGTKPGPEKIAGLFKGQECSNVCIDFEIPFETGLTVAEGAAAAPQEEGAPKDLAGLLVLAVIGGMVSLVMPCVYPLLPITLTYFIKQGGESRARSVAMSTAYALGIIIVFTGVGFLFSVLMGADGPRIFAANPWVNIAVALLFFWFAFSLFGLYEINLPSWLTGSLAGQRRSGVGGAFILGALFSIVTFTCTIPIAATILSVAATSGAENRFTGLTAMLVYSTTMAIPFFILGLFPTLLKEVPKSGGWLHTVKITAGFAELALAMLYLAKADQVTDTNILTRPVMIAIWVATLALMAFYLLGVFRMKGDDPPGPVGLARALVALTCIVMAVYMGAGFTGRSLGELDILLPVNLGDTADARNGTGHRMIGNYDDALAEARKEGRPIFLEFTGVT